MKFFPTKDADRLNRKPWQPDVWTGRAMVNPHYPVAECAPGSELVFDSTAFQTMLKRKLASQALNHQLSYLWKLCPKHMAARWKVIPQSELDAEPKPLAIVHYDQMVGVD